MITPRASSDSLAFLVSSYGNVHDSSASSYSTAYGFGVRPTFYLKSQVKYAGGDGSFDNPYRVTCDDCNAS